MFDLFVIFMMKTIKIIALRQAFLSQFNWTFLKQVTHQQDRCSNDEGLVGDVEANRDFDVEAVRVQQCICAKAKRNLFDVANVNPIFGDLDIGIFWIRASQSSHRI